MVGLFFSLTQGNYLLHNLSSLLISCQAATNTHQFHSIIPWGWRAVPGSSMPKNRLIPCTVAFSLMHVIIQDICYSEPVITSHIVCTHLKAKLMMSSWHENTPRITALIARFMGTTWGPPGADRSQVGPMLAPSTLLSGWSLGRGNQWVTHWFPAQSPSNVRLWWFPYC